MIFNMLIFAAPLSTIRTVMSTRDSSPIHLPFAAIGFIGCSFWFIYGLAINEIPLVVPNAAGIVLTVSQLILKFIFPTNPNAEQEVQILREPSL